MNYQLNDTVTYNKTNFVISAFLNDNNNLSEDENLNKWVLLYNANTNNQIKVNIKFISKKGDNKEDSTETTDDKLSRANF
ncbi:hypothetical protein SAMN05443634_105198 [Chishuiella changwenlii]|uniref:Uncharacterized protein n=1 Tax=Chishuiella changwenlii TaxID=1434701 RepID=A0A1M6XCG1_9FLAO|nr:hypothetical protein [Chishuiella changwenlii]GGF00430.1 hypothetical protein GCM10010984_17510 [Chishuiella changwenlii]SHL03646.1 hypothetical protein SAMN05443634_105198 [Chishuiella changwenlii]